MTGLAVSYGPDLPAGATTIVLAGITYLARAHGPTAAAGSEDGATGPLSETFPNRGSPFSFPSPFPTNIR